MNRLPIISLSLDREEAKPEELFSIFKKTQTLKKQQAFEVSRLGKVENRIKDLKEELRAENLQISKILADKISVPAMSFYKYLVDNLEKIQKGTPEEIERQFFKFLSGINAPPRDGLTQYHAVVDDANHLVICPNHSSCELHKNNPTGVVWIDLREFNRE